MISSSSIQRATFVFVALSIASPLPVQLHAAEPEAGRRDFSAEAEAAHHADRFEALRDPELRRHYLDQMDSRQRLELERLWSGKAGLEPGAHQRRHILPPEIRQLQEAMGGSQVDQFPSLRPEPAANELQRLRGRRSAVAPPEAIRALRDGAAKLDEIANRLEQLELYAQADAIRGQAQRLRLDARTGTTPAEPMPRPSPAQWFAPGPATPPALEPVPQPEIPIDPPKPQPLLDSPEATPQPDVEVEG